MPLLRVMAGPDGFDYGCSHFELGDPASVDLREAGDIARSMGLAGSQREAEISMVARDVKIAAESSVKLNLQHISTKESVELIREAKKTNPNLHAEAARITSYNVCYTKLLRWFATCNTYAT